MLSSDNCIRLFLRALEYPKQDEFDINQHQVIHHLVNWLENTKIRHYPVEDRAPLKSQNQADWIAAINKYFQDIDCPYTWGDDSSSNQRAIQWILQYAVGLEYSDNVDTYNETLDRLLEEATPIDEWKPPPPGPFPDIDSPEVKALVEKLRERVFLPASAPDQPLAESVDEITDKMQNQILPAVALVEEYGDQMPTTSELLSRFPLGFSTGNEKLDQAATVLRALYVQDLRNLQTQIDHAIEEMQALTANPKTTTGPVKGKRKAETDTEKE